MAGRPARLAKTGRRLGSARRFFFNFGGPSRSSLPLIGFALSVANPLSASEDFNTLVTPFLEEHCLKCHGEEKQKGDIRLDTLSRDFTSGEFAIIWQDVSDMLVLGDMPPEDEPRPPAQEINRITKAIDTELRSAAETPRRRKPHRHPPIEPQLWTTL